MPTASSTLTGKYSIDATHSRIGFSARHAMITKVHGSFDQFEGSGFFDPETPANSSVSLTIQAASIDTRNADRDTHLRSAEFFDVGKFPVITFVSTIVEQLDDDKYRVTGDLTIKGIAKPVVIDFDYTGEAIDPYKNHRIGLEGKAKIYRKDWGIEWNAPLDTGGVLVSEKITLDFEVSAISSSPH
jgi:polyisoprenoid-binding protein YceI